MINTIIFKTGGGIAFIEYREYTKVSMVRLCLFLIQLLCVQFKLFAQIDCPEFYKWYDSTRKTTEQFAPFPGYDEPPSPVGGFENFYNQLRAKLDQDSTAIEKVMIEFIVDIQGRAQCPRVIKTENKFLNDRAIALIQEAEFIPARQKGKNVISTMVVNIRFGPDSQIKKKGRN